MTYNPFSKRKLLIGVTPFLLASCMGSNSGISTQEFAPVMAVTPPEPAISNGAIFQITSGYSALTSGTRASQKGDIITILLVEQTRASKSNSASKDRDGGFSLTPPTTGLFSLFSPSDVATSGSQNFSGSGSADQSNSLQGQISVTVAESYPNGTMLVRGQKLTSLNRGEEHTQFSGLIRAIDVSPDNTIPSTKVADARIIYGGTGEIASASKQGWLQKFFSFVSPF
ncbi:flagellar basal body L-ring protein FlgH [uncultured Parasphingorhabdus sp.]|uniref:flagellar basal body L-ring protein FlgH n=1 Tax=uncultured Parasphingorhabdus sp. TaxID=2709694 RepID=UPI0030DCF80B|tara:strand:- start:61429 stop:62109 length:681 start_codon:yes stop_codon:yes gene_type:complete